MDSTASNASHSQKNAIPGIESEQPSIPAPLNHTCRVYGAGFASQHGVAIDSTTRQGSDTRRQPKLICNVCGPGICAKTQYEPAYQHLGQQNHVCHFWWGMYLLQKVISPVILPLSMNGTQLKPSRQRKDACRFCGV